MNDMNYVVITGNNLEEFQDDVNMYLSNGFRLVGGVSVFQADGLGIVYSQALVKGHSNELSKSNQEGAEES